MAGTVWLCCQAPCKIDVVSVPLSLRGSCRLERLSPGWRDCPMRCGYTTEPAQLHHRVKPARMEACHKAGVACGRWGVTSIEHAANEVRRGCQGNASVTGQRGVNSRGALSGVAMAILAVLLVYPCPIPQPGLHLFCLRGRIYLLARLCFRQ